jgi:hypothetical protein
MSLRSKLYTLGLCLFPLDDLLSIFIYPRSYVLPMARPRTFEQARQMILLGSFRIG